MSVIGSELHMAASHHYSRTESTQTVLEINASGAQRTAAPERSSTPVVLSPRSREAQPLPLAAQTSATQETDETVVTEDPNQQLLIALIEYLTGEPVKLMDPRELSTPRQQAPAAEPATAQASPAANAREADTGISVYYEHTHRIQEHEATTFRAQGVIRTADGAEVKFAVELGMTRSYSEESRFELQIGTPRKREDPLVINFSGTAAQLQDQRFAFDLDADGQTSLIPLLAPGSGYLVFDRNSDGKVNDGTELFGALSGNAYADLAELDSDGNQWIDRNDAAFKELSLWLPDAAGKGRLVSLSDAGVAALSTKNLATPFELRGQGNSDLGAVRSTGLYLSTSNTVGTTQQIDLSV